MHNAWTQTTVWGRAGVRAGWRGEMGGAGYTSVILSTIKNSPGRVPRLSPLQKSPGCSNALVHQLLCITTYELTAT